VPRDDPWYSTRRGPCPATTEVQKPCCAPHSIIHSGGEDLAGWGMHKPNCEFGRVNRTVAGLRRTPQKKSPGGIGRTDTLLVAVSPPKARKGGTKEGETSTRELKRPLGRKTNVKIGSLLLGERYEPHEPSPQQRS